MSKGKSYVNLTFNKDLGRNFCYHMTHTQGGDDVDDDADDTDDDADDTDVDNTMRNSKFVRIGFRNKKSKKNWK